MSTYGKYFAYGLKIPAFAGTTVGGYHSFLIEEWAWRKPIGLTGRESIGLFK